MYDTLQALIKIYKTKNVTFHNFTHDISQEYAKSSICAVTSYFEGFSLALLEAMKHGVPCVAFDCPFGPRGLINDSYSGFLVDNGDIKVFAERICHLIEDEELRKQFSKTAIGFADTFNVDIIMNECNTLEKRLHYMMDTGDSSRILALRISHYQNYLDEKNTLIFVYFPKNNYICSKKRN